MHYFLCIERDYVHQLNAAILYGRLPKRFRLCEMLFDAWCRSRGDSATALPAAKLVSDWPHAGMATRSQTSARQSAHSSVLATSSFAHADLPKATTDDRAGASSSLLSSQRHYSRSTVSRREVRGQQVLRSSAASSTSCGSSSSSSSSSIHVYDQEISSTATSTNADRTSASARTAARHSAAAATAAGHCAGVPINSPSNRLNDGPSYKSTGLREVDKTSSSITP